MSRQALEVLEKYADLFSTALQSDLENGIAYLNDLAAKEFATKYPALDKVIGMLFEEEQNLSEEIDDEH